MNRNHRVHTTRELRVLASPERQELVQSLLGRPPMSVRELGELLGRLPVSLYYHLRALEKIGLVVRSGSRAAGRGEETLYALPAGEITIRPDARGAREVGAMRRIGAGAFRRALRLHDAMVAEEPSPERRRREHMLAQRTVKLDARGLERVNRKLYELADLLQDLPPARDGAFYTVTLHLARNPSRNAAAARSPSRESRAVRRPRR